MLKVTTNTFAALIILTLAGCSTIRQSALSEQTLTTSETVVPPVSQSEIVPASFIAPSPAPQPPPPLIPAPLTPQQVDNLWQRIALQMQFDHLENKQIVSQRNWYLKHPNYIKRVSKRAEPYLHFIVEEIEKRKIPLELALLPVVESAFDPFAYSHGRASGMWQIISGTGKRFGLAQNWWYDGRRDVYASTHAALDYLEYLHKYFKGDWLHAIAAYNSGEGRVGRAIRKNRKAGKATDFWSLKLPTETKDYVPRLLALAQILKHPDRYDISWPTIANEAKLTLVNTRSQIDLAFAAQLAGMELNELHQLNPGFNRWATDPNGSHQLFLPIDNAKLFNEKIATTAKKERLNWVRYKIKQGDSLGIIARRHQTTIDVIRAVNNIESNIIRAGKHLLIPVAAKQLSDYKLTSQARLAKTQSKPRRGVKQTHVVRSGDNLWNIARKYKVNYRSIAKWNGMAPKDPLRPGQNLVIWDQGSNKKTTGGASTVIRNIIYKVRPGDSIARIAQKFSLKVADVIRWNALNAKKYLQPGQKLKLYIDVTRINS